MVVIARIGHRCGSPVTLPEPCSACWFVPLGCENCNVTGGGSRGGGGVRCNVVLRYRCSLSIWRHLSRVDHLSLSQRKRGIITSWSKDHLDGERWRDYFSSFSVSDRFLCFRIDFSRSNCIFRLFGSILDLSLGSHY